MNVCSVRWTTPTSIILAGPSGSGKTHFLKKLLNVRSSLFDPAPKAIFFFYKVYQNHYSEMKNLDPSIFFIDELPQTVESFKSLIEPYKNNGSLVIFDDYENEIIKNISLFSEIWTVLSHHMNCTPLAVLHNLFAKEIRTISLNTHRIILTKSLRDSAQISYLSRQCYPHVKNFLPSVYKYCMTLQDYPYLILNFSPGRESDNYIKVSTSIFENERPMLAFKEDKCHNGKGGNPYEKLVLLNQNFYNILKQSGGFSDDIRREETSQEINNSVSNFNNIKLDNDTNNENGSTYRKELKQSEENDQHDKKYSAPDSKYDHSNKNEGGSSLPFKLPPIDKVFMKNGYNQDKLKTKIKPKRNLRSTKTRPSKTRFYSSDSKVMNEQEENEKNDAMLEENADTFSDRKKISNSNDLYQNSSDANPIPKSLLRIKKKKLARVRSLKTKSNHYTNKNNKKGLDKKSVKHSFDKNMNLHQSNKGVTGFMNSNGNNEEYQESENDGYKLNHKLRSRLKKSLKRKAQPLINREIHPFKAMKNDKGVKRKRKEEKNINRKIQKTGYKLTVDPSLYQKWNF